MTWGLVAYAKRRALSALAHLALPPLANGAASHGPATITAPRLKPSGKPTLTEAALSVRAHRLHNRDPIKAAMYLEKHKTLARGVCSDE